MITRISLEMRPPLWRFEDVDMDLVEFSGNVKERYDQLTKYRDLDWDSFHNGWLEGRLQMAWEWEESGVNMDLKELHFGKVKERYHQLTKCRDLDWDSFYNGWLEGRIQMVKDYKIYENPLPVRIRLWIRSWKEGWHDRSRVT
jgi:hypothetical protein